MLALFMFIKIYYNAQTYDDKPHQSAADNVFSPGWSGEHVGAAGTDPDRTGATHGAGHQERASPSATYTTAYAGTITVLLVFWISSVNTITFVGILNYYLDISCNPLTSLKH